LHSPVLIGASGGSGTRVLRDALAAAGYYMGYDTMGTGDSVELADFFDRQVGRVLATTRRLDYALDMLPAGLRDSVRLDLEATLASYLQHHMGVGGAWGLKGPRTLFMLPFFHEQLPELVFVQMIRDGRDMALSSNQGQLRRYYQPLYGEPLPEDLSLPAARLWAKANLEAADWCQRHLPGRHWLLRYEDLCRDPRATFRALFDFLGAPVSPALLERLAAAVVPSPGIGRWRQLDREKARAIADAALPGLTRFGYG
jgi:hypothetical protein